MSFDSIHPKVSNIVSLDWDRKFDTDEEIGHDVIAIDILEYHVSSIRDYINLYEVSHYISKKDPQDIDNQRVIALREILKNLERTLGNIIQTGT